MQRQTSPKVVLTLRKQPEVKPRKRLVNPHGLAQIILAVVASILLGALVGRVYVAVSKTHAFKQTRSDIVSFVTGRPRVIWDASGRIQLSKLVSSNGS
jgi:hypothetical protein